jgi:hypothetical protein
MVCQGKRLIVFVQTGAKAANILRFFLPDKMAGN